MKQPTAVNMQPSLPLYKKLNVLYRIEPGCLGPQGVDHAEAFCVFAKQRIKTIHGGIIRWAIIPRYDKSLAELEYKIKNVTLTHEQAARFLLTYTIDIQQFEEMLDEVLYELVEAFFDR